MMLEKIKSSSLFFYFISLFICLLGIIFLQNSQYQNSISQTQVIDHHLAERNQKSLIKLQRQIPSLGFNNLRADWIFLKFVQYFGDESARNQTGYSLIPDYFETMIEYDPHFTQAYLTLSTANTMYAGQPDKTVALMTKVLQSTPPEISPQVSFLWTSKGLDELLFLGDSKSAQHSYQMAAFWSNRQKNQQGKAIAERNLETARFLATNPDTKQAQIAAWKLVLPNLQNQQLKQQVIDKIQSLETEINNSDR